jgi:DHA3 family macrolide efflux protein-like MFS transporter
LKKFFVLWSSQAASMFGTSVVGFALAWYLAKETGSATVLATALMVSILPGVIMGPFIGPFIDRWSRKKIMIYGDLVTMLLTLVLMVLFYTNTVQVWHIYVIMVGRAISGSFQNPALRASISMIVPQQHLTRANGLNMTLRGAINIVGPPTGAFLMDALEVQWVLSVDIITAVIAIGCLLLLEIPQPPPTTLAGRINVIGDMVQGFRYVVSWRGLLMFLILFAVLGFFSAPGNSLLPIFVLDRLGGEVFRLGWLQTARGAGVIAGGLILGIWGGFKRRIVTCFTFIIIQAAAYIVFSFTTENLFLLSLAMLFITGLSASFINAPVMAVFQSVVAKDIQGRFFTLMDSIIGAMLPLGLVVAGPLADAIGVHTAFFISGAAIFILTIAAFFSRDMMDLENRAAGGQSVEEMPPPVPRT